MCTIIKYSDSDGNQISPEELGTIKFYNKEFYINDDELKLIEKYGPKGRTNEIILKGGEYYLSSDENLDTIIEKYSHTAYYWAFNYDKQTNAFGDIYWEYLFYENGELNKKGRQVYNNKKLLIASCTIDLITNELDNQRKNFYGDLDIYKRFSYETYFLSVSYDNAEITDIYIYDDNYTSVDKYLSSYNSKYFDWMTHTYFHNFEPMLPNELLLL